MTSRSDRSSQPVSIDGASNFASLVHSFDEVEDCGWECPYPATFACNAKLNTSMQASNRSRRQKAAFIGLWGGVSGGMFLEFIRESPILVSTLHRIIANRAQEYRADFRVRCHAAPCHASLCESLSCSAARAYLPWFLGAGNSICVPGANDFRTGITRLVHLADCRLRDNSQRCTTCCRPRLRRLVNPGRRRLQLSASGT